MEISNPGEIGLELKNHLVHFLREDQARRSMREASVGYKHGICFFLRASFSGPGLITGLPMCSQVELAVWVY